MNSALAAYAQAQGLPPAPGPSNVLRLEAEKEDSVVIEARGDILLAYRIHPLPFPTGAQMLAALRRCDIRLRQGVQVGLRGAGHDAALFMVLRLDEDAQEPRHIDEALHRLKRWQAEWAAACATF